MNPPIYPLLHASAAVTALLGSSPMRLYPFGEAFEGVTYPYATWFTITGQAENYLGQLPDVDEYTAQIDVWSSTADLAVAVAKAIRDALEPSAYMTDSGTDRDPDTQSYRYRMSFSFYTPR